MTMQSQDVISFEPKRIKIVRDKKDLEALYDPNHYPIIKTLRKGPMTVREIEQAYKKEAQGMEDLEAKSDKTIYRYLKVLEKAGLVVPAGQRVVMGKTATETLFARTAEVFLGGDSGSKYWESDTGKLLCKTIGKMLGKSYGDRTPDYACIEKFMQKIDREMNKQTLAIMETGDEELFDLLASVGWKSKNKVLSFVGYFAVVLNEPKRLEALKNCFE
jgi:DNA-binding transcriptional ArsR family regulator